MGINNIPTELKERPQWVWHKEDKSPRNPRLDKHASVSDPGTWGAFAQAINAVKVYGGKGIGFVFTEIDPYCGIDFDHCITNGQLDPKVEQMVTKLESYTEYSLSKTGLHVIIKGKKPRGKCRVGQIEVYDRGRHFCMTGNIYEGKDTIEDRQAELDAFYEKELKATETEVKPGEPILKDVRDNTLTSMGGAARRVGATEEEIEAFLLKVLDRVEQIPGDEKAEADVKRIAHSVARYAPDDSSHNTDTGNAEFMAKLYGDILRYDHRLKRWLLWGSHHWIPDSDENVARLAVKATKLRYIQAVNIKDTKVREAAARWAITSESKMRVDACLSMSSRLLPFADKGEDWDTGTMLLGCENGVLDLRTGELRAGRPEDRVTMTTRLDYDPDAECARWKLFLTEVFDSNEELIDWLWRALGYTLTGDMREQMFVVGYGEGANGKSTLFKTIFATLGDYAHLSPFSTFSLPTRSSTNDLRAIDRSRFLISSETNEGTKLNMERIKPLTGGDPMSARYLYKEFATFTPQAKLWLFVNHKPDIDDDSLATWRRVRLIPFTQTFIKEKDDKQLDGKLKAEAQGILAWLVRGCLEWQKRGLIAPQCIRAATGQYRHETDPLLRFLDERCIIGEGEEVRAGYLYSAYKQWVENEKPMSQTSFGLKMSKKFDKREDARGKHYLGVGLARAAGVRYRFNMDEVDSSG